MRCHAAGRLKRKCRLHCVRASAKLASTQKCLALGRAAFVSCPQTVAASRQNAYPYDGWASGQTIYAYVEGNPVAYTDVLGLQRGFRPPPGGRTGRPVWRSDPSLTDLSALRLIWRIRDRGINYEEVRDPNQHYTQEDVRRLEEILRLNGYTPPYAASQGRGGSSQVCVRPGSNPTEPVYGRGPGRGSGSGNNFTIPQSVLNKFPSGVVIRPNNKGIGYRWSDGKGNGVRIDQGNPARDSLNNP